MDEPVTMERIAVDDVRHEHDHRLRYHLARGLCDRNDRVLDAACGVGYGSFLLSRACFEVVAVDKEPVANEFVELSTNVDWLTADLNTSERDAALAAGTFDVAVTFETIEHLIDPQDFVFWLCQVTTRTIIASVPVVPSKHFNEFHLHDFTEHDLPAMFNACGWELAASLEQPSESSKIYVFGIF